MASVGFFEVRIEPRPQGDREQVDVRYREPSVAGVEIGAESGVSGHRGNKKPDSGRPCKEVGFFTDWKEEPL